MNVSGKVLEVYVAEVAEEIIQETCKELEIEVIALAVTLDLLHLKIGTPKKNRKVFIYL